MHMEPFIPREITSNVPVVTITGNERVQVEQHMGLIGCGPEEVTLRCAMGVMTIRGQNLRFALYTAREAIVTGQVTAVWVPGGEE